MRSPMARWVVAAALALAACGGSVEPPDEYRLLDDIPLVEEPAGDPHCSFTSAAALHWVDAGSGVVRTSMDVPAFASLLPVDQGVLLSHASPDQPSGTLLFSEGAGELAYQSEFPGWLNPRFESNVLIEGDTVVMAGRSVERAVDWVVVAADLQTGAERWRADVSDGRFESIEIADGVVVVVGVDSVGLDLATGGVLWTDGGSGSIAHAENPDLHVYRAAEDRGVEVIEAATGRRVFWEVGPLTQWLERVGDVVVVWTNEPEVRDRHPAFGLDARTGEVLWRQNHGARAEAVIGGDQLVVTQPSRGIAGYDTSSGKREWLWSSEELGARAYPRLWSDGAFTSAAVDPAPSQPDRFVVIDQASGSLVLDQPGDVRSEPLVADGVAFVGGLELEDGMANPNELSAVTLATGEVVWEAEFSHRVEGLHLRAGRLMVLAADPLRFCD